MARKRTLADIVDADLCIGCGACAAVLPDEIEMRLDARGRMTAVETQEMSRRSQDVVLRVCPGLVVTGLPRDRQLESLPLWGPVRRPVLGHSTDSAVRFAGSSGGALSATCLFLLESGRVSYIVQVAASPSHPARSYSTLSASRDDVIRAAGSRYQPAVPLEALEAALQTGRKVAIVGRPCDVAAIRNLSQLDSRIDDQVGAYLSIFCAGIPSMWDTLSLLDGLGTTEDEVAKLSFRGEGWPGSFRVTTAKGEQYQLSYEESWGTTLNRHLPWRCKICPDGSGELADLSFGDGWYLTGSGDPSFEEAEGRSVILARSSRGNEILDSAHKQGYLAIQDLDTSALSAMQPFLVRRKREVAARLAAWAMTRRPQPTFRALNLFRASAANLARSTRAFLATARRLANERSGDGSDSWASRFRSDMSDS